MERETELENHTSARFTREKGRHVGNEDEVETLIHFSSALIQKTGEALPLAFVVSSSLRRDGCPLRGSHHSRGSAANCPAVFSLLPNVALPGRGRKRHGGFSTAEVLPPLRASILHSRWGGGGTLGSPRSGQRGAAPHSPQRGSESHPASLRHAAEFSAHTDGRWATCGGREGRAPRRATQPEPGWEEVLGFLCDNAPRGDPSQPAVTVLLLFPPQLINPISSGFSLALTMPGAVKPFPPTLSSRAQHGPSSGRTSPPPRPFPSAHYYLPARMAAVRPGPTTAPRGLELSSRACARRRHVSVLWARDASPRPPPRGLRLRRARARARVRGAAWPGPAAAARPRPAPRRRRRRRRLAGHEAQPAPERGPASRLLKHRLAPPPPPSPAPPSPPRPGADPPFAPLPPRSRRHVGPRAAAGPPLSPGAARRGRRRRRRSAGPGRPPQPWRSRRTRGEERPGGAARLLPAVRGGGDAGRGAGGQRPGLGFAAALPSRPRSGS